MADVEVVVESEPRKVRSVLDNYYADTYGEQAATVASVVALASHAELFDHAVYEQEIVDSYFLSVPNSTLIVNRVDTNDQYGLSKSFTVLDGDVPLLQLDGGRLTFNALTFAHSDALQQGQRELASPLLVSETFFQMDVTQALTREGVEQARAILSQGEAITPDMVTALNDLMVDEEDIRRQEQVSRGRSGDVRYPRFTEYELQQNLSIDTIARQLSARAPMVDVQAVAQPEVTQVSLDQQRPQAVVQEPPVAVTANGQRVTAAPQAPSPVAPKVQPPTLKPNPKEATMTVVEAPAPVDLKPIKLDNLLSEFGQDAMRGITGTRNTYNPSTKSRGSEERTPGETFAKFAKGAYGIENFCKDNSIPFQGSADYLVNKTALELDISPEFKAEILSGIKREECVAPVTLATETEVAAWKRVYELEPETFAAVASPAVQETIAQDASVIAQAKAKTLEMMGITMKTVEPTRDPAKLGYEPAPATPETAALMEFRDSLTASQLREWATAVQVNEPQNTDKQKWVADFTAKFQKSGYEMSDGSMSVGMAKRLTEVQQQMGPDVQQLRTEMAATINQMLSQAPNVEGKDYKKLEATKLGLTIKGNEGNFEVKGATGKLLMLAKEGEVTINRIPATVVSRMEGMVAMQQQMQQATVQQRTVAPPAKKAAAVER